MFAQDTDVQLYEFVQARRGLRVVPDNLTETHDSFDVLRRNGFRHRFERGTVAVNIAKDRDTFRKKEPGIKKCAVRKLAVETRSI